MRIQFNVEWRRLFKSLTIFISLAIIIPVSFMLFVNVAKHGFSYNKAFPRTAPIILFYIFTGVLAFASLTALLVSLLLIFASITVTDDEITGRNYWGRKKRIPLKEISALTTFRSNGINAIVVCSKKHGKIYISDHTENLKDLIELLATYLPKEEKHGA